MTKKSPYEPRLKTRYRQEVMGLLKEKFGFANDLEIPRLEKIVLNVGMGEMHQDSKLLNSAVEELSLISGQRPVATRAKKAISNFKIRKGNPVGCAVTLRRNQMYEFLDRLISIAIPRIKDFRGLPDRSFDGHGNYSFGVKEQIVFPEIDYDRIERIHGLDITLVTSTEKDTEAFELLKAMGMPFALKG